MNPHETAEIPGLKDDGSYYVVFDQWPPEGTPLVIDGRRHGLLLCIEVFKHELEYAREHRSAGLIEKLKQKGHYPYSDLDRQPAV